MPTSPRTPSAHPARRAFAALALLLQPLLAEAAPLPAWQRSAPSALPDESCQELRIERTGSGPLEIRFLADAALGATGPDFKIDGASLLVPPGQTGHPSLVVFDEGGPHAATASVPEPLRWIRRGGELCIASGAAPKMCAELAGGTDRIRLLAHGEGWDVDVVRCGVVAAGSGGGPRAAWAHFALGLGLGALALALLSLLLPGRFRRGRVIRGTACVGAGLAAFSVPPAIETHDPVPGVATPLLRDAAFWHPRAAHQSLEFRGRPVYTVDPERESWLVLGGSVTFGEGIEADETFVAKAEARLRSEGRPVDLYNAGAQGWNLHAIDTWLRDMGDRLAVDGIVIVSILNNATLPVLGDAPGGCRARLATHAACNRWRSPFFDVPLKVLLPRRANAERHRELLRRILERELALGREIVLLDEPKEPGGIFDDWLGVGRARAVTEAVAGEFGLPLHPVADALAPLGEGAFLDGIHPTAEGHRVWGERLADVLAELPRR